MKNTGALLPVIAAVVAVAALSMMDALIKHVSASHSTPQVVFLRYGVGFLVAGAILLASGVEKPTRHTYRRALLRIIFILGTAYLFFKTLTLLPLAEAVAITFTAPFFMIFASKLLLKEPIPSQALGAVLLGFAGVVLMASGNLKDGVGHGPWLGYATGIGCSLTYALAMVTMRRDTGHDGAISLVFAQNAVAALAASPLGILNWTPPTNATLGYFAAAGVLGTIGHLLFAWAYSQAPASRLAPLEYSSFLWASGFGLVFFSELPTVWTLAGAGIIVAACLMATRSTVKVNAA